MKVSKLLTKYEAIENLQPFFKWWKDDSDHEHNWEIITSDDFWKGTHWEINRIKIYPVYEEFRTNEYSVIGYKIKL